MSLNAGTPSTRANDLILASIEAYKHGRSQAAPTPNLDEKFNVQFLLAMLVRVSLSDLMAMLEASQVRARALALSQAGRATEARTVLDLAHSIGIAAALSNEATIADRSFQNAAAAYLHYKTGEYNRAEASILDALDCCRMLRDQFGYAVESRRIHLVRHIVRVRSVAGRSEAAFDMACLMVRYVEGEAASWPFPEVALSADPDAIETADKSMLLDQLLSEMSSLLTNSRAATALLTRGDGALFRGDVSRTPDLSRVYLRLSAMRAVAEDDLMGFLESAAAFFQNGPGYMPRTWREMSRDLIRVCRQFAPAVVAELDEECT